MASKITRTVYEYLVTVKYFDSTAEDVKETSFTAFDVDLTTKVQEVKKSVKTEGNIALSVNYRKIMRIRVGMSVEDFVNKAEVLETTDLTGTEE